MTETPDRYAALLPKPALHHSMLAMLSKCGEMVRFRYIEGIIAPPGIALLVGTAVHKAAEDDLKNKMAFGTGLPLEKVKERAKEAFNQAWDKEGVALSDEEKTQGEAVVRGAGIDESVELSALHSVKITPIRKPTHVERKLRLVLDGFPFDIEGTIDVQEGDDTILDRKTSSKSPSGGEAEGNPQLDTYALMKRVVDGTPVKRVGLDYLVKTTTPKAVTVYAPAPAAFDSIVARVERAAKVLESGAFYPVDPTGPSGWVCQPKWCGYYDRCAFGRARRKSIPLS